MRKKILVGNWKLNKNLSQTGEFLKSINANLTFDKNKRFIIAPSFVNLEYAVKESSNSPVEICCQNISEFEEGAYTGEVSAKMLTNVGVNIVIIGHSERREFYFESNNVLKSKIKTALNNNFEIIFCFGENLLERKNNNYFSAVKKQIVDTLFEFNPNEFNKIILAYEPVWAIGTGENASAEQAQEIHLFVRELIENKFGVEVASNLTILYGGSLKPNNSKELFQKKDVDGGLVGGASLNPDTFLEIYRSL